MHAIHSRYKNHFRKEIENPSADTNHILNFSLKLDNFMMMNEMFHFLTAGAALFGIRTLFGNSITKYTVNYLGQRRGDFAAGAIYFISFFYITNKLNK